MTSKAAAWSMAWAAAAVATLSTVMPWAVNPAAIPLAIRSSSSQSSTCMVGLDAKSGSEAQAD
ncbi:hypothetical protein D3C81_1220120 [compost metagenome]